MTKLKGISFPTIKDINLVKNTPLFMVTDKNKMWIEAGNIRITEPRKLLTDSNNAHISWIRKVHKD